MKNLNVKVGVKDVVLNLPTSINEITIDYLNAVTKEVKIEKHYALVALCINEKLNIMCDAKKKNVDVKGVAILVNLNDPNKNMNCIAGEKLIISPTDLMMGNEVACKNNVLSPSKVISTITSDKSLISSIFSHTETVYLVSFKLVPLSSIHGSYSNDELEFDKTIVEKYMKY